MKTVYKCVLFIYGLLASLTGIAQVATYNSLPEARATLYLDFDGQLVTATSWNWDGAIQAKASALSAAAIKEITQRVAEDFSPFQLNVTTDIAAFNQADKAKRLRIIITPTHQWYGEAAGVSFIGSFNWGDGTPAFVFEEVLNRNVKYIAETISHEAGHAMGLHHQSIYNDDCSKLVDYNGGRGIGETGWAPIMGVGYYKNLTTWHNGSSALNCNSYQNDMEVIAGATGGFRTDDYSNEWQKATLIPGSTNQLQMNGIINDAMDKDVFRFEVTDAAILHVNANPLHVAGNNEGANLDIQLRILNHRGEQIGRYNPSATLNATIDTLLAKGSYYLEVDGAGNQYYSDAGIVGNYVLNGNLQPVSALYTIQLKGNAQNNGHQLQWNIKEGKFAANYELQVSKDGTSFVPLTAIQKGSTQYFNGVVIAQPVWYRIKALIAGKEMVYSNLVDIKQQTISLNTAYYDPMLRQLQIHSNGMYLYQLLDASGRTLLKGSLQKGNYMLQLPAANGLMLLQWQDDNGLHTYKFIKH